ncbi:MAG: hypothetical protein QOJ64_3050 [Acidobacteriota bacterium]|nr:hypothetical protein [Acidobacteriota bacterium]
MGANATTDPSSDPRLMELWAGILGGPLAALIQLETNYALVRWACGSGHTLMLHLVSFLALAITLTTGTFAYRIWHRLAAKAEEDDPGPIARSRFMALVGTLVSILMSLLIIALWLPIFLHGPCER